jgi:hypothetical protein
MRRVPLLLVLVVSVVGDRATEAAAGQENPDAPGAVRDG